MKAAPMIRDHMDNVTKKSSRCCDEEETEESVVRAKWKEVFNLTTQAHLLPPTFGILLAISSGIIIPVLALLLGQIFDTFTDFGAGKINGTELTNKVSQNTIYLVALATVSWVLNGSYYMFWVIFGELQAKSARDKLFNGMLDKEMKWFDMRKAGVSAMIPRLQT